VEPDDDNPANAWLYVATDRSYMVEKMRPSLRRGTRELRIEFLTSAELLKHGVRAYCDTRRRNGLSDGTPEEFHRQFAPRASCPGHSFLGAWKDDVLAAVLPVTEVDDWVEFDGCLSMDALLRFRPNDTLLSRALSHYLTETDCRIVSFGVSSIQVESKAKGLHTFKKKLGFEARAVHRAFVLHPLLRPLTNSLTLLGVKSLRRFNRGASRLRKAEGILAALLDKQEVAQA
jgi:hypothetical protein